MVPKVSVKSLQILLIFLTLEYLKALFCERKREREKRTEKEEG